MDIRPPKRPSLPLRSRPAPATTPPPKPSPNTPPIQPLPPTKTGLKVAKAPLRRHLWRWITVGVLGAIIAAVIGAWCWYNSQLSPPSSDSTHQKIVITSGMTADDVADTLQKAKIIRSQLAFKLYIKISGHSKLQAGTYLFAPNQSVQQIVTALENGKVDAFNITIAPGLRLDQIKTQLEKAGFSSSDIDAAFAKTYSHSLLASKPQEVNLEGYIFPDTYQIDSTTTVESLLIRTFDRFQQQIDKENLLPQLQARGLSLHQAITLASIIEKETPNETDQKQVAQVFLLRLQRGMQLGSDPTYVYAAHLLGVEPSVNVDSPYNTRKYSGLPPGAIDNFNISALAAVAHPADGDYLYFVADPNGATHFAHTFEEHQANVDRYCASLCQQE